MAKAEQLNVLLQDGVAAWNQWRKMNPDIKPDLSKADLSSQDLETGDFSNRGGEGVRHE